MGNFLFEVQLDVFFGVFQEVEIDLSMFRSLYFVQVETHVSLHPNVLLKQARQIYTERSMLQMQHPSPWNLILQYQQQQL